MINAEQAVAIEKGLARLLDVPAEDLRDYIMGNIRAGSARRTGFRFVRGAHGGAYVRDPNGNDLLPAGYEAPPG